MPARYNSVAALVPSEAATEVVAIAAVVVANKYLVVADGVAVGWQVGPEKQGGPSLYQKADHRAGWNRTMGLFHPRTLQNMHWSQAQMQARG